mmetsp:Transcript_8542/g.21054  ORF Transcript_8542/g.21054 Transcript_8542/m.21054 type:complete len:304 (+) Transcript_8542:76-987(+)
MHTPSLVVFVAASGLCVFSTEAFAPTFSRGATTTVQSVTQSLPSPSSSLSSSLYLFPFSRKGKDDIGANKTNKEKGLKRRLSDDNNEDEGDTSASRRPRVDDLVQLVSLRMRRVAFLSWWSQVILTVISTVTLLFTRNVLNIETSPMGLVAATNRALLPNYFLAGSSIVLSFGSVFWTWATRRLSRRLLKKPTTRVQAANMLRKSITVGTSLNLMGMAVALLGAEQIVGGLAIKVLTTSTGASAVYQAGQAANLLQPLDILVVQANTNTLFSHFCSIVAYLFLGRSIGQLDPPSVEGDERPRA